MTRAASINSNFESKTACRTPNREPDSSVHQNHDVGLARMAENEMRLDQGRFSGHNAAPIARNAVAAAHVLSALAVLKTLRGEESRLSRELQ